MLLYSIKDLMIFTWIFFFYLQYSLKNYRVLDIYRTKLIESNKNFGPNRLSFSLLNHQFQAVFLQILWNGTPSYIFFPRKVLIWKYSKPQIQFISKRWFVIFFSFFLLFVCFVLFRLLKFFFQYFTSIKNLPDMKNSTKKMGWISEITIPKFFKSCITHKWVGKM